MEVRDALQVNFGFVSLPSSHLFATSYHLGQTDQPQAAVWAGR